MTSASGLQVSTTHRIWIRGVEDNWYRQRHLVPSPTASVTGTAESESRGPWIFPRPTPGVDDIAEHPDADDIVKSNASVVSTVKPIWE
jgi:hypothetical protein